MNCPGNDTIRREKFDTHMPVHLKTGDIAYIIYFMKHWIMSALMKKKCIKLPKKSIHFEIS